MLEIKISTWLGLIFIVFLASETAIAQSNTNTEVKSNALHPTEVSSDISTSSLFIHFDSKYGFVYETIGLPLIGEHYPLQEAIPDKISVNKYGPNESVNSVIISKYHTKNAGYKAFSGISLQTGKLIWLGFAVLFGFIAGLSRNLVAAFIGKNHPALNNLFWYGLGVGFFLGIFINFNALFGENRLIYFDNANNAPYRLVVNKHDTAEIGANENIGVYVKLGWNDLEVHPATGTDNAWYGKIFIEKSDGYLVYNINGQNEYNVETAVWRK